MANHPDKIMDVTQLVIEDHNDIKYAYNKILALPDGEAKKWFNELLWTIARHSASEEIVVYPLLEKTGPTGKELADKSRHDHQKVKEELHELDGKSMSELIRYKIDKMMKDLLSHIQMEEEPGGDLDQLRNGLSQKELDDAGKSFERIKKFVPTHPHPSAPDKPPFETLVGFLTAPIDKLRDMFRDFPDDSEVKGKAG